MILNEGFTKVSVQLNVSAKQIKLWWPANLDDTRAQPLYDVTVTFTQNTDDTQAQGSGRGTAAMASSAPAAPVSATRRIGFRTVALVTGNDTDPACVQ